MEQLALEGGMPRQEDGKGTQHEFPEQLQESVSEGWDCEVQRIVGCSDYFLFRLQRALSVKVHYEA